MYKLILSLRYLKTRWIALASILSVCLGVATLIVVNAVMSGFSGLIKDRIHNTLADVIVQSFSTDGVADPERLMALINETVGDEVAAMTPAVEVFGVISYEVPGGEMIQRPVTLVGIDPKGKDAVSPMREFLLSRTPSDEQHLTETIGTFPAGEPLNWDLSEQATAYRRQWLEYRLRSQEAYAEDTLTQTASTPFDLEPQTMSDGTAASEPAAGVFDPFATSVQDAAATSTVAEPTNPFFDEVAAQPSDPFEPSEARLYVGAGLISQAYPDAQNPGGSKTMMFAAPGQDITVTTIKAGVPEPVRFAATICDVFKSGMAEYDQSYVFCNLEALQAARGMLVRNVDGSADWRQGAVTQIQIKLKDYANAPIVVQKIREMMRNTPTVAVAEGQLAPPGRSLYSAMHVETWEQRQAPIINAVAMETAILNILLGLIICVAGFGILAIFYMIVAEKTRDIGILKALGASSRGVMSIFLSYGLALGLVGSGFGVILGLVFINWINEIEEFISAINGRQLVDETVYYFSEIPTSVHPMMVVSVAAGAILIAVLASVLPALRAARLNPVQALRWE